VGRLDVLTSCIVASSRRELRLPDQYFVLLELLPYIEKKLACNRAYRDRLAFGRMCLHNTAAAGKFSSDRTVREYAEDIWQIKPMPTLSCPT
jgi:glucan phosphorylase